MFKAQWIQNIEWFSDLIAFNSQKIGTIRNVLNRLLLNVTFAGHIFPPKGITTVLLIFLMILRSVGDGGIT